MTRRISDERLPAILRAADQWDDDHTHDLASDLRDERALSAQLAEALRNCDGDAYLGQLEGEDKQAFFASIQSHARAALAAYEAHTKEGA